MTTIEAGGHPYDGCKTVTSAAILREIRARVLTLVKNPPKSDADAGAWKAWKTEVEGLGQLEIIYSRPEIIPLATGDAHQVRP